MCMTEHLSWVLGEWSCTPGLKVQVRACHWWLWVSWVCNLDTLSPPSGCCALGIGYLWIISTGAQSMDVWQCPWVEWWDASIYTRLMAWWWPSPSPPPPPPPPPDTQPYYMPTWIPVIPHSLGLAYHWTDWGPTKSNVQLMSCWQKSYYHGVVISCEFCLCMCFLLNPSWPSEAYVDGLVRESSISSALVMEMLQSCSGPPMYALAI